MNYSRVIVIIGIMFCIGLYMPVLGAPGDADGNGLVEIEDARCIARYLVNQLPAIPNPADADATQDGMVDIEDAFVIARHTQGDTRIVVAAPRYGRPDCLVIGDIVRISVFEKFFPFHITGGTVRIQSVSTDYDSGDQPLVFEQDGRSLYYHWDTRGLTPASDYEISVTLDKDITNSLKSSDSRLSEDSPTLQTSLSSSHYEPIFLENVVDAYCTAPGIALEFRRVAPHDSGRYPYQGPLGYGWVHTYDICLEEYTDGMVAFHGPHGYNRFFESNDDGTYTSSKGDYGTLTRDTNGTIQLKEKNGIIYRFRSDLRLDFIQDLNENRISMVYDGSNHLVEIRHSNGDSFSLEYNDSGRIVKLTDHAGRETLYEYYEDRLLIKATDAGGGVTDYVYHLWKSATIDHRLLVIAYPDDTHIHYQYDTEGRVIRKTGHWGANPVDYNYDDEGSVEIVDALGGKTTITVNKMNQISSITDPDNGVTQLGYDSNSNLTKMTDPLGHITEADYDGYGNITKIVNPLSEVEEFGYDFRFHKPAWKINPLGRATFFNYDTYGNLTRVIYPDFSQEHYSYDANGNLVTIEDALGNMSNYTYNSRGLITSQQNALGYTTDFSYDLAGQLESVTDAKGNVVSFTHDNMGRIKTITFPDGTSETYEYNGTGEITSVMNRANETILLSYDVTGRLEWKEYPSGRKIHFQYDPAGYLWMVDDLMGEEIINFSHYERDASHRITRVKVPGKVPPESYDVSYAYDEADKRIFMSYPDGYSLHYEYDAANRLSRISDYEDNTIVSYEYDAADCQTGRTLGNGTYTTYEYDEMDRLTLLVNHKPNGEVLSQFSYTYNDDGIRTSMSTLEGIHQYTYDAIHQVTKVEYPDEKEVQYQFDKVGSRVKVIEDGQITTYTCNNLDQYSKVGDQTFDYDSNGNLIQKQHTSETIEYFWNVDNKLIGVNKNGIQINYQYDQQGRLISKTMGGKCIRYIWDNNELIAEMDSEGNIIKRYIYGNTTNEIILISDKGANYWCLRDGLGSVIQTTKDDGTEIGKCSYDVYGTIRSGNIDPVPVRFAGMFWDADASLYYVKARWYDPKIGRFPSTDMYDNYFYNQYCYVENNPINLVDINGKERMEYQVRFRPLQSVMGRILYWVKRIGTGTGYPFVHTQIFYKTNNGTTENFGLLTNEGAPGWHIGSDPSQYYESYTFSMSKERFNRLRREATIKYTLDAYEGRQYGWWGSWLGFLSTVNCHDFVVEFIWGSVKDFFSGIGNCFSGLFGDGGVCPTFIQGGQKPDPVKRNGHDSLVCHISTPWKDSLLRSDIPIYGMAGGEDFVRYKVEYGKGKNPINWHLIEESTQPQLHPPDIKDVSWMQGDLDLKGNLATWNVGLKNWSHLPWHPPEDATDLNGIYTIRLVVEGQDGKNVEDRVTCEVGRVIAQCLPGIAQSPDERVIMRFPEQSLSHPFRVYTILPLPNIEQQIPPPPRGCEFIGTPYRVREPGDCFIKDVELEFIPDNDEMNGRTPEHMGICSYDTEDKKWSWLKTAHSISATSFTTVLKKLPTPRAIFALVFDPQTKRSSPVMPKRTIQTLEPVKPGVFVKCSFEKDFGAFKPRDYLVGAGLERDNQATPDGSYCMKLTNENYGGNFSCTILDRPFDLRAYPTMSFDYRIQKGIKTDFFLKVANRWYRLRFTGDPIDFKYQDVNITDMGKIDDIMDDEKWHTASIDLAYLLRQQTRHTRIEEIMMADWDVGGYMKLCFGNNPRGATYYLDNFRITGPGLPVKKHPSILLVDDFNVAKSVNALGGATGTYCNPGTHYLESSLVDIPPRRQQADSGIKATPDRALQLTFNMASTDAYGGWWTSLEGYDLNDYNSISFRIRSQENPPPIETGIRDKNGIEGKTLISPYVTSSEKNGWMDVHLPLSAFRGLDSLSNPDILFFSLTHKIQSGEGMIWIDDLQIHQVPREQIADFESPFEWNLLGGNLFTWQNGAAAISASRMNQLASSNQEENTICRVSYGGSIGLDYGPHGGFSFCGWQCDLKGADGRFYDGLRLKIKGENGGETPNFYLSDGSRRVCLRASETKPVKTNWQEIYLPLSFYASRGIDISHLDSIQLVFEWERQSGTIYIDDIEFVK